MLKYVCEFTVEGNGTFPFDMLRYDRCSPFSSEDANKVGMCWQGCLPVEQMTDTRTVNLIRFTEGKGRNYNDKPTERRWQSFGWKVTKTEFRKL